ncbi:uncharacterized protein METZ01_LOCUS335042, partial [marine metagenome]
AGALFRRAGRSLHPERRADCRGRARSRGVWQM